MQGQFFFGKTLCEMRTKGQKGKRAKVQKGKRAKRHKGIRAKGQKGKRAKGQGQGQIRNVENYEKYYYLK